MSAPSRAAPVRRRSLAGYLLVPRPKDLSKAVLLPVAFGIGSLAAADVSVRSLVRALVVLIAVELLLYAARYQWNDVRGFVADQRHPAEADRGRLPGPLEQGRRHVLISSAVAAARLVSVGLLVLALPTLHLWPLLGWAALGVFGVAIAYETLRSVGTGRTDRTPPPVRPLLVLIWVTIGAGYAVRGLVGVAIAVDLSERPGFALAAGLTLWCGGVVFATTRWAVEATAFGRVRNGEVQWTAKAGHAREHLLALARWLPSRVPVASTEETGASLTAWRPLRERTPLTAPWHVALVVGGASAGLTGALIIGRPSPAVAVGAAIAGAVAAAAVAVGAHRRFAALLLGGVVVSCALALVDARHAVTGALPWLLLVGAYVRFVGRALEPADRTSTLRRVAPRVLEPLGRLLLGRPTWELLSEGGRS